VRAMWAVPKEADHDRVLLCIHGGGYVGGSMFTHRKMFAHLAKAVGARALVLNYTLLPAGVCPLPVHETVPAYRSLLEEEIAPARIAFTGDSAGGGLSITAQLLARHQGLPLPGAAMLISTWLDMEVSGETMVSNLGKSGGEPLVPRSAAPTPHARALLAAVTLRFADLAVLRLRGWRRCSRGWIWPKTPRSWSCARSSRWEAP
jgi:acetyl esterase/lipase